MRPALFFLSFFLVALTTACAAEEPVWKLVWQDDFNRAELGDGWVLVNGEARIRDGRLYLEGGGATILVNKSFAPDVRLEFEAEADPERPPCDLSVALAANPDTGGAYLLAFGGMNNRLNQLLGSDPPIYDLNPKMLIEHHKIYRLVAIKEGRHLSYTVNGATILETDDKNVIGGPGFDMLGLVTWTGMYADNVKVYERGAPAPDTPKYLTRLPGLPLYRDGRQLKARPGVSAPGLDDALADFNSGNLNSALARFEAMGDTPVGLAGQAYVWGDLSYEEDSRAGDFVRFAERFRKGVAANPDDSALADYGVAADYLSKISMGGGREGSASGGREAIRLVGMGPEDNPFYHKALFYHARFLYWRGREGGNQRQIRRAKDLMRGLKTLWPENVILRQYTGEDVPWSPELNADTSKHPAWAAYLREAYARQIKIMETWCAKRQAPDGSFGGGWGDDCEMMRTWMQIAAISSGAEAVRAGIERLADGIWKYALNERAFSGGGDVEHSSEPSADMFPTMLLIRYGDPLWAERNMASCKIIRDVFMGIDSKGYPRFKSSEYGADGVVTAPQAGGDTAYNARTMKHFIWQAWRGDPDARDWFVRWCDGWRAAAMSKSQDKPVGVIPGSIFYPSGEIYRPGGHWRDEAANYYGPDFTGMIHGSLLTACYFSGDRKFLKPFQMGMDWATRGPLVQGDHSPPSQEWLYQMSAHMPSPNFTSMYRWLTGERVYDEYTKRFGDPAQLYPIDHDLDGYMNAFKGAAEALRYNLELQSTEVIATDRYGLPSSLAVFGAYTGAILQLRDENCPTFAVTYDSPNSDFAALVTETTPNRLRVWLYSFNDGDMRIALRPWLLTPGSYVLNQGELLPGEYDFQHRYGWLSPPQTVRIAHRAEPVSVDIPPGKTWVVDLRLDEPIEAPSRAPDLAVMPRDVVRTERGIAVTVHNIGSADSKAVPLVVQVNKSGEWHTVARTRCPGLRRPRNYTPSTARIEVAVDSALLTDGFRVVLDPEDKQYDLYVQNNSCEVRPQPER